MVVEAGVVAGYVIAWAVRKARRVGGRLDRETDTAVDAALDRLHEAVAAKLGGHPVLADIVKEAEDVDGDGVSELTLQEATAAIARAAAKDDAFRQAITDLVAEVDKAKLPAGTAVYAGPESAVFTEKVVATGNGIVIGRTDTVNIGRGPGDPPQPGRRSH